MKPSGYTGVGEYSGEPGSNGLTLDQQGRRDLCRARRPPRLALRLERRQAHAGRQLQGKRLNSPNDVVFKSNGDLYFTDPPYGLPEARRTTRRREIDFCGVYRWSAKTAR